MISVEVLLIASVYPLIFLQAYFWWSWFSRAQKLEALEIVRKKRKIILSLSATRMIALFIWACVEAFSAIYAFLMYVGEKEIKIGLDWINSEIAHHHCLFTNTEKLLHRLRRLCVIIGSSTEYPISTCRQSYSLAARSRV